jgi:hypothetical protein
MHVQHDFLGDRTDAGFGRVPYLFGVEVVPESSPMGEKQVASVAMLGWYTPTIRKSMQFSSSQIFVVRLLNDFGSCTQRKDRSCDSEQMFVFFPVGLNLCRRNRAFGFHYYRNGSSKFYSLSNTLASLPCCAHCTICVVNFEGFI